MMLSADEMRWRCAAAPGGYAWWYADLMGEGWALSVILFAGAVFSPEYAARARAGAGDTGLLHPAVHVSLGRGGRQVAWVMNEHPAAGLRREPDGLQIGRSGLRRQADGTVVLDLDEATTRFFAKPGERLAGRVVLRPDLPPLRPLRLSPDQAEAHFWQPLCLRARAEVELTLGGRPVCFSGLGYHDSNFGEGRLERTFSRWGWAHGLSGEEAAVLYRVDWERGGHGRADLPASCAGRAIVVRQGRGEASIEEHDEPGPAAWGGRMLPGSGLGLRVPERFTAGDRVCVRVPGGLLLAAPFYARYRAEIRAATERPAAEAPVLQGVGEYLDLRRFRSPAIQFLLRYKTRRLGPAVGAEREAA